MPFSHRVPTLFAQEILTAFNAGELDALTAAQRLHVSPAQLYRLRHHWLRAKTAFAPTPSGGNHKAPWPPPAHEFLAGILSHSQPLNFALLADELARKLAFARSRATVAAYVRQHFPQWVPALKRGPKPRRRWQCAAIGVLWQHDSSPHPWWPADHYPTLILAMDDHSRKILGGTFVPSDSMWAHFTHFRPLLESFGPPACLYTDGLSLFGPTSTADRLDTHSQFQRAFTVLGVAHRVATDAQAKGKIERRFDTLQKRLVTLLGYAKSRTTRRPTPCSTPKSPGSTRTTLVAPPASPPTRPGTSPSRKNANQHRPAPLVPWLDLHLALCLQRRLNAGYTLDFLGKNWPVTPAANKYVTLVHHPEQCFWVIPQPPDPQNPVWPDVLAHPRL